MLGIFTVHHGLYGGGLPSGPVGGLVGRSSRCPLLIKNPRPHQFEEDLLLLPGFSCSVVCLVGGTVIAYSAAYPTISCSAARSAISCSAPPPIPCLANHLPLWLLSPLAAHSTDAVACSAANHRPPARRRPGITCSAIIHLLTRPTPFFLAAACFMRRKMMKTRSGETSIMGQQCKASLTLG
ncbi:hypothetical protein Dimus_028967, partial [Dionaea muscipula]